MSKPPTFIVDDLKSKSRHFICRAMQHIRLASKISAGATSVR